MVVPERSPLFSAWQAGILGLTILGVAFFRNHDGLVPWLLYLGSKAVVAAFFFGYARLGACLVPVVALCVALCGERWAGSSAGRGRLLARTAVGLLVLCLALETVRWARPPHPSVDGQKVETVDPFRDQHQDQRVEWLASDRN
jgi:hypothetical protein